jgi:hypothetical protein
LNTAWPDRPFCPAALLGFWPFAASPACGSRRRFRPSAHLPFCKRPLRCFRRRIRRRVFDRLHRIGEIEGAGRGSWAFPQAVATEYGLRSPTAMGLTSSRFSGRIEIFISWTKSRGFSSRIRVNPCAPAASSNARVRPLGSAPAWR